MTGAEVNQQSNERAAAPRADGLVVEIDTRLIYGLIGLACVVAVAVGGFALARSRDQGAVAAAPAAVGGTSAPPGAATALPSGALRPSMQGEIKAPTTVDGQPMIKRVLRGRPPASPDEVPLAPNEARLWLPELADTDFVLDFGMVRPDGPTVKEVVVTNVGTAPLLIHEVGGDCGCTLVVLDKQALPVGEETRLTVSYDPRVGVDAGKPFKKPVWISSSDPLVPVVQFHIQGDVLH